MEPVAETLAWAAALGLCRLAPGYFLLGRKDQSFLSGIPSPAVLWRSLVDLVPPTAAREGGTWPSRRNTCRPLPLCEATMSL